MDITSVHVPIAPFWTMSEVQESKASNTLYVRSSLKDSSLSELCVVIIVVGSIGVSSRSSLAFTQPRSGRSV